MQEIEKQLHLVHALSKDVSSEITEQEINSNLPIGRVASVTPNSPSDEAVSFEFILIINNYIQIL